jgi:DnaJ-class molecular chaperone
MPEIVKCKKCKGLGTHRDGSKCATCQGSGRVKMTLNEDGSKTIVPAR